MKNFLIVTDFSAASRQAGLYGVELAKHFGAKVFLFHAFQAPVQVPESYLFYNTEDVWSTLKEQLLKEADSINPEKLVEIEVDGSEGAAANAILVEAKKKNADLIICGMKATVKGLRRIFGSTSTSLARLSEIPLLIIPEDAIFTEPDHIALACDMDTETAADTAFLLKEFEKRFHSKLSIVRVVEEKVDDTNKMRFRPTEVIAQLKEMHPVFEFPQGSNISKALEDFAKDHSIKLMSIIPHKHNFLERFFVESTTTKLIFHTHIPLLILPQKMKNTPDNEESGFHVTGLPS